MYCNLEFGHKTYIQFVFLNHHHSTHFLLIFVHPSFKEFASDYIMMDFHHNTYLVYFTKSKQTLSFRFQTIQNLLNLRNGIRSNEIESNMDSTSFVSDSLTTKCKCAFQAHFNQPNWFKYQHIKFKWLHSNLYKIPSCVYLLQSNLLFLPSLGNRVWIVCKTPLQHSQIMVRNSYFKSY